MAKAMPFNMNGNWHAKANRVAHTHTHTYGRLPRFAI